MSDFFRLLMEMDNAVRFDNQALQEAWPMIERAVRSGFDTTASFRPDPRQVVDQILARVRGILQQVDQSLNGKGGKDDRNFEGPDGKSNRPLDNL